MVHLTFVFQRGNYHLSVPSYVRILHSSFVSSEFIMFNQANSSESDQTTYIPTCSSIGKAASPIMMSCKFLKRLPCSSFVKKSAIILSVAQSLSSITSLCTISLMKKILYGCGVTSHHSNFSRFFHLHRTHGILIHCFPFDWVPLLFHKYHYL